MSGVNEAEFQRAVTDLATWRKWRWTHFRPAMLQSGRFVTPLSGDKGFPDLILVRAGRLVIAELKTETGRTTPEQDTWLAELAKVPNSEVFLWKPSEWDEIKKVLT